LDPRRKSLHVQYMDLRNGCMGRNDSNWIEIKLKVKEEKGEGADSAEGGKRKGNGGI